MLSDPITLPTGFTLAADYGTLVLAAGQSTSFAIRLDSPVEGSFSGTLSITTDDPVQPTFDVTISGTVVARVAGVDDSNFESDGDGWTTVDSSAAVGGQELTAAAGIGENTASWVFNDLNPDIVYEVYATWTAASGQATNAGYTILDGSNIEGPADVGDGDTPNAPYVVGTLGTISVDQTAAPGDETVGGIAWSSLGSFTATSGVMEIDLSDAANGTVVAGGIRIVAVHVTEPPVLQPTIDQTTTAGDGVSIQLGATDPDAPSGDLSYALLSGTPPGLSVNSSTGLITWDTTNVPAGTYGITAQVSDGGSPASTDVQEFSITVNNSATPTGSGEDTVIVYSSSDANEGGTPGDIRLLRTGDQTGTLTVMFQIDETVGNAAQYGSTLEYVGPSISTTVDGILYGEATFAADANTTDITINAGNDTDNADNPTVNFELLPDNFTIPGDAGPDFIASSSYNVGTPSTATPVIRDSLQVANGSTTVGLEQLAADHHVLAQIADAKAPAGATITYKIIGGNGEGVFTLTPDGRLLLAKDAASALRPSYSLEIQGIGTFADGTQTNVSDATEDITMRPTIGVYGDTMAIRGSADTIDLTFIRFATNISASLTVNFTIDWGDLSSSDVYGDEISYDAITSGHIIIPANEATVTMVLYASDYVTGDPPIGEFIITLDQSSDANAIYDPTVVNTHLPDANADTVLWFERLYILDGVTAFAPFNQNPELLDELFASNPGINANDVSQAGLGDCYFLAAEAELAQSDWQAIQNLITQNSDGSFTVKIYNNPAASWPGATQTGWVSFTFTADQLLTNGWSMAQLSGDYNPITGAVEIWPQLLEAAWMKLTGGTYQGIISGQTSAAMIALTGLNFDTLSLAGMPNQDIGQSIQKALEFGPVSLATMSDPAGTRPPLSLGVKQGSVHFNHAYVVESVDTDGDGHVIGVNLLNPWGFQSGYDYMIYVPLADFSTVFAGLYYEKPFYWR